MSSDYERIRLKNVAENKRILTELGLDRRFNFTPKIVQKSVKRKSVQKTTPVAKRARISENEENLGSLRGQRRRSSRIQGKDAKLESEITEEVDDDEDDEYRVKVTPGRPNIWGAIEGVEVGTLYETRLLCCAAGVHRPTVAGIHGGGEGAYSIALSGGYEDDIDMGEAFTYTGQGGRDLKGTSSNPKNLRTAAQSKDQTLSHGNLALTLNCDKKIPVRVIRGYKLKSPYAPVEGYRYDGLYMVEKYWFTTGLSGFGVYKFALKRCMDQVPPPWTYSDDAESVKSSETVSADGESKSKQAGQSTADDEVMAVHVDTSTGPKDTKDENIDDAELSNDENNLKDVTNLQINAKSVGVIQFHADKDNNLNNDHNEKDTCGTENNTKHIKNDSMEKVDKALATNESSVASNESSVATNKASVATNKSSVATNESSVATNETSIAMNESLVARNENESSVATNESSVATNESSVATNESSVATNESSVATNESSVATNESSVVTNESSVDVASDKQEETEKDVVGHHVMESIPCGTTVTMETSDSEEFNEETSSRSRVVTMETCNSTSVDVPALDTPAEMIVSAPVKEDSCLVEGNPGLNNSAN